MKKILLVDAYNIFARSYAVNPSMSENGQHIGGTLGFLKSLGVLASKFSPNEIVICWEGGGSARRRKILPEYKTGRKPIKLNRSDIYEDIPDTRENFNYQVALCTRLLKHMPVKQMYVSECEADDIIGYLARYAYDKNDQIVIASSDQDMYQLLSENITQYSPAGKKMVTHHDVESKFDIYFENFITARAFIGDKSDAIPGIKGCGFKTLVKRIPELRENRFLSVDDIIKLCEVKAEQFPKIKLYRDILENKGVPKRNWKIMYLDISNLSATHIDQLKYSYENAEHKNDKISMMRDLITEGVTFPNKINIDRIYYNLNASIK